MKRLAAGVGAAVLLGMILAFTLGREPGCTITWATSNAPPVPTPRPVNISGMAFTRVSVKFGPEPNAPLNIAAKVTKGLALNMASRMAVRISEIKNEASGTKKIALRDNVFRFSNTTRIIRVIIWLGCC